MAMLAITRLLDTQEIERIIGAHDGQTAVSDKREEALHTRYHHAVYREFSHEFRDAPIKTLRRNRDRDSMTYGLLEVVLDTEHPMTEEIRQWCYGWGWHVLDDGTLRNMALVNAPVDKQAERYNTYGWYKLYTTKEYVYASPFALEPTLSVTLDYAADHGLAIDATFVRNDDNSVFEPCDQTGTAKLCVVREGFDDYVLRAWGSNGISSSLLDGHEFWHAIDHYHLLRGYDVSHCSTVTKMVAIGSEARLAAAMGVPRNEDERLEIALDRKRPEVRKGRFLDIDDGRCDPGAMAHFPAYMAAPELVRYERTVTRDYDSRRRRNVDRITYEARRTHVEPLAFGLTANHQGYCLPRYRDAVKALPMLDTYPDPILDHDPRDRTFAGRAAHCDAAFWETPVDRLLVLRTPLGWHGLFLIGAEMPAIGSTRTNVAHVAYIVPVFVPHAESKHTESRYRHLPGAVIEAIRGTYGLDHFLTQALYTLAGAKAKAGREGYDPVRLPALPSKVKAPAGHAIRAWGATRVNTPYCVTRVHGSIAKNRAHTLVAEVMGWSAASGHVPFFAPGTEPVSATAANVQPVATRRVLDI